MLEKSTEFCHIVKINNNMHKFELAQYSHRTEITVYLHDKKKLIKALRELGIVFLLTEFDEELRFRTMERLLKYQCDFCRGRIMPKPPKNKPRSKKKPKFDYNIVTGLSPEGELMYKRI